MADAKAPIRWPIVLFINVGMLAGCVVAYFIVPPNTRLPVLVLGCLLVVIALNIFLYFAGYRRSETKLPLDPAEARGRRRARLVLFAVSWTIILLEILRRYVFKK